MMDIKDETEITATITVGQRAYGVPLEVAKQFAAWGACHKSMLEALELLMGARDNDGMICPSGVVVAQVKAAIAKAKGQEYE